MDELIDSLVEEFSSRFPNEEEIEVIKTKYREFLVGLLSKYNEAFNGDEERIKTCLIAINDDYMNQEINEIKRLFIVDESLEELKRICKDIEKEAVDLVNGKQPDSPINLKEINEKLYGIKEGVKPFNEEVANNIIGDALLNANFLQDSETPICSRAVYLAIEDRQSKELNHE